MIYVLVLVVSTITGTHTFEAKKLFQTEHACQDYYVDVQEVLQNSLFVSKIEFSCEKRRLRTLASDRKPDFVAEELFGGELLRTDVTYASKKVAASSDKPRRRKKHHRRHRHNTDTVQVAKGSPAENNRPSGTYKAQGPLLFGLFRLGE